MAPVVRVNHYRRGRVPYVYAETLTGTTGPRGHGGPGGDGKRGLWFGWRQQGVAVTSTGKAAEADVAYVDAGETLRQAGHLMRELGVGALRVRGEDGKFQGTISPDMMVRRIAAGGDPKTVTVGEVAAGHAGRPGHSRGAAGPPGDHGPDQGSWAWADRVQAWDQATLDTAACLGADITAIRQSPGLVA